MLGQGHRQVVSRIAQIALEKAGAALSAAAPKDEGVQLFDEGEATAPKL